MLIWHKYDNSRAFLFLFLSLARAGRGRSSHKFVVLFVQILAKEANSSVMLQYVLRNITSSSKSGLSTSEDLALEAKIVDNLADVRQKNKTGSQSDRTANMLSSGELMQYNDSLTTVAQNISSGLSSIRSNDSLINDTITLSSGLSNLNTSDKKGSVGSSPLKSISRKFGPLEKSRDREQSSTTESAEEIQALEDQVKSTAEAATKALEAAQATRKVGRIIFGLTHTLA